MLIVPVGLRGLELNPQTLTHSHPLTLCGEYRSRTDDLLRAKQAL